MPKLPVVSGKELIKAFEKIGFITVRQESTHVVIKHTDPKNVSGKEKWQAQNSRERVIAEENRLNLCYLCYTKIYD
ncbi:hypothetical protein A3A74_00375 [Candidatus Roizmanbacteria bacterium RIFCSPLOWO2_01_FULL_35_13]|uniref:Addiction module toxin, HicA family n=1 Tax=Candidatus Roizmanbacteria bacterium RIFCSPLOWO2_01_FULL_35_13 TaxID=1802055 RepID=A0A1F7I7D3_9BACT|nr:MAG: hypothetical protein A3A74_00375 [Candidatus Roizmanbacteria bacterium RIFCSPLOWO2_01_FULL_35_13]